MSEYNSKKSFVSMLTAVMIGGACLLMCPGCGGGEDAAAADSGSSRAAVEQPAGTSAGASEQKEVSNLDLGGASAEGNGAADDSGMEIVLEGAAKEKLAQNPKGGEDVPAGWELVEDRSSASAKTAASKQGKAAGKASPALAESNPPAKKAQAGKASSAGRTAGSQAKKKPIDDGYTGDEPLNKKSANFEPDIDYKKLIKNPGELGFKPSADLFRDVYFRIRTSFVEGVSDDQLEKGVTAEVGKLARAAGASTDPLHRLDKKKNILTQITDAYKGKINETVVTYSAIMGMMRGLGDPFSVLMTPKEYSSLKEQVQTQGFGGIGIYIEADKDDGNQVTVFEPMEGAPAYNAGIEAGDKILAIDGRSTKNMALDVATKLIRGKVGSKVALKIKRTGVAQPFVVNVPRSNIKVVSCTSKMYGDVGYIRMRQFGASTSDELAKELAKVRSQGARAIILDLRNNGGGFVQAAVGVGSQFIKKGGLIVYTLDRAQKRENLVSQGNGSFDMPMIVMINRFSASASEITAGAMRDNKLAKLVGERSFGKGSVQQVFPFDDGSALKMTIARFYSPSGHVIDHNGLVPDVVVKMEPRFVGRNGKDTQLKKALEMLSGSAR